MSILLIFIGIGIVLFLSEFLPHWPRSTNGNPCEATTEKPEPSQITPRRNYFLREAKKYIAPNLHTKKRLQFTKPELPDKWDIQRELKRKGEAYDTFINSYLWKKVMRPEVLARDNYICQECKKLGEISTAKCVHHTSYPRGYMNLDYMRQTQYFCCTSLCSDCHARVHSLIPYNN